MSTTAKTVRAKRLMNPREHKDIYGAIADTVANLVPGETEGLDKRVQAGVAFLDATHPNWADTIDLELFSLFEGSRCVIGQLYGGQYRIEEALFPIFGNGGDPWEIDRREYRMGFNVDGDTFEGLDDEKYEEVEKEFRYLESQWRQVIEARRLW